MANDCWVGLLCCKHGALYVVLLVMTFGIIFCRSPRQSDVVMIVAGSKQNGSCPKKNLYITKCQNLIGLFPRGVVCANGGGYYR